MVKENEMQKRQQLDLRRTFLKSVNQEARGPKRQRYLSQLRNGTGGRRLGAGEEFNLTHGKPGTAALQTTRGSKLRQRMKNRLFSQDKPIDQNMEVTFSQTNYTADQSLFDTNRSEVQVKRGPADNSKITKWLSKTIHIVDPVMHQYNGPAFVGDNESRDTS